MMVTGGDAHGPRVDAAWPHRAPLAWFDALQEAVAARRANRRS